VDQQKSGRGGARVGAGRKKSSARTHAPPHRVRSELSAKHPVHVVLRTAQHVSGLRQPRAYQATCRVLVRYVGRDDFRIVHVSIQENHFHLLMEAADREALSNGMRSLAINLARGINRALGSSGKVFAHRYHVTQITTARQARNSLVYVLNNWRKHRQDFANGRMLTAKLDPYASGLAFDGWCQDGIGAIRFSIPEGYEPLPVSAPRTGLLRSEWKRFGRIDVFECPGPIR
jgi:REP element-mobilizing transposase RayT